MLIAPSLTTIDITDFTATLWDVFIARHSLGGIGRWIRAMTAHAQVVAQATISEKHDATLRDPKAETQAAARQIRILIVEDESIVALEMRMSLRRLGHDVVALAATGPDAVHLAGLHRPDVILMDIRLKGHMDGIEAAAAIRAQMDTPLIFVTGQADEATVLRAQRVGPAAYLNKPIAASELAGTIANVVGRHVRIRGINREHTE